MRLNLNIDIGMDGWLVILRDAGLDEKVAAFESLQKSFAHTAEHALAEGSLTATAWQEMAEDAGDIAANLRKIQLLQPKPER